MKFTSYLWRVTDGLWLNKMSRLFFALWPDTETRDKFATLNERLPSECGRKVQRENLHITLSFLGSVEDSVIDELLTSAAEIRGDGFPLVFDQLGWFKRSRVTWLASTTIPDALLNLVKDLNSRLQDAGFKVEDRPYSPHLTLARKAKKPVSNLEFEPIYWNINKFCLVESITLARGAEYKVLGSWPLSSR